MNANEFKTETGEVTEVKQEETTVSKQEVRVPIEAGRKGLDLRTLDDIWRFANYVIKSGLTPKGIDKPEAVVVALQMGYELGLPPMQALQNIAVINGRPCVWGDAVPGLVEASGKQEYGYPTKIGQRNPDGTYPDNYGYRYTTKRKGREEYSYEFTVADAKLACLWNKKGKEGQPTPWVFYPDRMLLNRARTFCLRDVYPDVLRGLVTDDEAENMVTADFTIEESKSRTEKLVDLITPQVKPSAQLPVEQSNTPEIKTTISNSKYPITTAAETTTPEPVTPEPTKRGRPKKEQGRLFPSAYPEIREEGELHF